MDIPQVQGEGLCVGGVRSVGYQMVDLRKAYVQGGKKKKTKTMWFFPTVRTFVNLMGVSEWMYEMVAAGVSPNVRM